MADLATLYTIVRETVVQKSYPLTRTEVLSQELCATCARLAPFVTYPTKGTLQMMEIWAQQNVARKDESLARQEAYEDRQRRRNLEFALKKRDDVGFVNGVLATMKVAEPKPRPKHRQHHHVASSPRTGEKRYGDERKPVVEAEAKPKKNKKKGKADSNSKKGGRGR